MAVTYIFDVPVYRLKEDVYNRQMKEHIEDNFNSDDRFVRDMYERDPDIKARMEDHLFRSYGGMWKYNEIIGYIRLHFLGSQVRGEYYTVRRKSIVRTRRKQLEYHTWKLAPEREIPPSSASKEIYSIVLEYVAECRKILKRRYIDSSGLERIGSFVDWRALYDASARRT